MRVEGARLVQPSGNPQTSLSSASFVNTCRRIAVQVARATRTPLRAVATSSPAHGDAARAQVDDDLAHFEHVVGRGWSLPAENGADPREQLVIVERARDVVVAAAVECAHAIDGVGLLFAEHDHRDGPVPRAARLACPQTPAHIELGREQDEVGTDALDELQRLLLVFCPDDVEAVVREVVEQKALGHRSGSATRSAWDMSRP